MELQHILSTADSELYNGSCNTRLVADFVMKDWLEHVKDPGAQHSKRPYFRISVYDAYGRWALTRGFRVDQLPI